jgi:hypothetical protein
MDFEFKEGRQQPTPSKYHYQCLQNIIINPSKISLSQFYTMSTFHIVQALLMETVLMLNPRY